jgi:phosphatidylglycerophosphate synthase
MVLWMTLAALAFVATDLVDGRLAREAGLATTWGAWLDHGADVAAAFALVATLVIGSREPGRRARAKARAPRQADAGTLPPE